MIFSIDIYGINKNLQGVGPGILTLSPVPYEEILKFFFDNTECVSIDLFMLLEQTTAMLSLTILKKKS